MKIKEHKISVVIPAYNAEKFMARSIDSLLAQTRPVDEIIVVDDGSTDGTAEVIQYYGGKVRYIYQDNAGVSTARNTGIHAASGDWVAFLDADDTWRPEKTQIQTDLLKRNPELVWVSSNYLCQDESTGRSTPETDVALIDTFLAGRDAMDYFDAYVHRIWGHTSNYIIRKNVLLEAGLFEPHLNLLEDMDLWWKIAYRYPRQGFTSKPLSCYHFTTKPHGLTRTHRPVENYVKIVDRHLELSAEYGRLEGFQKTIAILLQAWVRRMLFEDRPDDIKLLLRRYPRLLGKRFKWLMKVLLISPKLTRVACRTTSGIVRLTGLRKKVVPRPPLVRHNDSGKDNEL